jgi:hypothetical protein
MCTRVAIEKEERKENSKPKLEPLISFVDGMMMMGSEKARRFVIIITTIIYYYNHTTR